MLSISVLSSAAYQWTPAVTRIGWVGARTYELRTPGPSANWLGGNGNLSPEAQQARARELALIEWLKENGVHLSSEAGWGRAAPPLRVESATVADVEPSGRGLRAARTQRNHARRNHCSAEHKTRPHQACGAASTWEMCGAGLDG